MAFTSLPAFSTLLVAQLFFLGAAILLIHRLNPRFGLGPLLITLGMLTAANQFGLLGFASIQTAGQELTFPQGAFLLLPVMMLGLLVIYIVNGTRQARIALSTMVLISLALVLLSLRPDLRVFLGGSSIQIENPAAPSAKVMLANALNLGAELLLLIVIYQALCNLRNRYPSRLAAALALLAAVWADSLLSRLLSSSGQYSSPISMLAQLAAMTLAAIVLWPLLIAYISATTSLYPDSVASVPRPTLDIFATAFQLEERSRLHYYLLRIISQISKLIGRTSDPQVLLERACRLLVTHRNYALVWIGLVHAEPGSPAIEIHPAARAGRGGDLIEDMQRMSKSASDGKSTAVAAARNGQATLIQNITEDRQNIPWQKAALERGFRSLASLPMRHAGHILGVLSVYSTTASAFDLEEIDLLQELADDLARALISLEARQQQAILHTAAETMQDGLFITNMDGRVLYANPAIAQLLEVEPQELEGQDIRRVFPPDGSVLPFDELRLTLENNEKVDVDLEQPRPDRHSAYFSIRASIAYDTVFQPAYIVINVRDTTRYHLYEHQLLTLNRFTTELIQAHEIQALVDRLFKAGEALLQADGSGFFVLGDDGQAISQCYGHNMPMDRLARLSALDELLPEASVLTTQRPITIPDVEEDATYAAHLQRVDERVRALLVLPVLLQERLIGALALFFHKRHPFSEEDIQLGLTLAHTLAISLENTRLYQAEKSQSEFAEALANAAAALNSSLEFDQVLDQILEQAIYVVQCRSVNIMLIEGDQVRVMRHLDRTDPSERRRLVTGKHITLMLPTLQQMLQSGNPLVIPNTHLDPLWRQIEQTSWIRSYAAAPLQVQDQVIGFLNMNSDVAGFFDARIIPRLQAFANTAAAAIQNARLYQRTQQYAAELEDRVRERTGELRTAKERIEHILVSVPEPIIVLDEDDHLIHANPAGEGLMARAAEQGMDLFAAEFLVSLKASSQPTEQRVVPIHDQAYQVLASSLPVGSHSTGTVIVFRDVTRFRELDQMKTQFVSDVSHELRTPLTNLALYLDLLARALKGEKNERYMATLRRETQRLTSLIEDLLTISRLEADRLEIIIEPVDINRLITDLAQDRMQMATNQSLTLTYTVQPELPLALADSRLLTRVLSNLLTNALNYTPPGRTIQLRTSLQAWGGTTWVTAQVEDTGLGIPPEEMEHLFTRFFRGYAGQTSNAPGTGLGLAISKEIIDRLNGRITVESQLHKGSTFTVWLPAVL
jgi:PAS domain S-box-containing protein